MQPKERSQLSNTDRARLDIVLKASVNSECRAQHAASVYKSGRLLAIGINKSRVNNRWHPNLEGRPASTHAEIAALNQVEDARGCILYVARSLKNGDPAMSKPCADCEAEIKRRGIKKVIFTIDSSYDVD